MAASTNLVVKIILKENLNIKSWVNELHQMTKNKKLNPPVLQLWFVQEDAYIHYAVSITKHNGRLQFAYEKKILRLEVLGVLGSTKSTNL